MPFISDTSGITIDEPGAAARLAELCQPFKPLSVLLVTDKSVRDQGLLDEAKLSLKAAKLTVTIFDRVDGELQESVVLSAFNLAHQANANVIVGFGDSNSMDVAKLVALLASPRCEQKLTDLYGVNKAGGHRLPLIQIPTTTGDDSEITATAVVTTSDKTKSTVVSPLLLPDVTVIDSSLTTGEALQIEAVGG